MDKLIARLIAASGLLQYPDANLYNAARRLAPEDRPTVPVRLYEDPAPVYAQFGGAKPNPDASAVVGPKKDTIWVDKTKPSYRDLDRLAGVLAHEEQHVRGADEIGAKLREYEVLRSLVSRWKMNPRLKELQQFYDTHKDRYDRQALIQQMKK